MNSGADEKNFSSHSLQPIGIFYHCQSGSLPIVKNPRSRYIFER